MVIQQGLTELRRFRNSPKACKRVLILFQTQQSLTMRLWVKGAGIQIHFSCTQFVAVIHAQHHQSLSTLTHTEGGSFA